MRFQPDTLLEAVLRPLAMAAPDGHVYVELMAPDFRFVFAAVLLLVLAALALRHPPGGAHCAAGRDRPARPVLVLLAALAVAFVPWLATSGNGRYFASGLLTAGPVCVGLAWLLPTTRALRLTLALGMVALQAFAIQQSAPWRAWALASWTEAPYFQVEVPAEVRSQPATFVTLSAISYSLLAPQLHPRSRWINLHQAPHAGGTFGEWRRTDAFLDGGGATPLLLLVPTVPGQATSQGLPNEAVSEAIAGQLAPFRLAFLAPPQCRFLPSRSLAAMGLGEKNETERARSGFWLCPLKRVPMQAAPPAPVLRYDAVFRMLEVQCPRLFPPGGDGASLKLPSGEVRSYLRAEMKAYVYDSGEVYYKYYRALNPVLVGRADALLGGTARIDCGAVRGRSGLPWDREI